MLLLEYWIIWCLRNLYANPGFAAVFFCDLGLNICLFCMYETWGYYLSHFQAWYKNRPVSTWGVMQAGNIINQRHAILSPHLYMAVKKKKATKNVKREGFPCVSYYSSSPLSPFHLKQHCRVSLPIFLHGIPEWDDALWVAEPSFGFAGFCNNQTQVRKLRAFILSDCYHAFCLCLVSVVVFPDNFLSV